MDVSGNVSAKSVVVNQLPEGSEAEYTYGVTVQLKQYHPVNVSMTIRRPIKTTDDIARLQALVEGVVDSRVQRLCKEGWQYPAPAKT